MGYNPPMGNQINPVVYAVVEDYGDGSSVVEVFSTRALAEAFMPEYEGEVYKSCLDIVEWAVDTKVGWRRVTIYKVWVSIASELRMSEYTDQSFLPHCETSGSEIGGKLEDRFCLGWSTASLDHAEELALAGRNDYLHTSSIVTLTPEGNAPVAFSK